MAASGVYQVTISDFSAEKVGIPVLASIPANDDIRKKSANYEIIGTSTSEWGPLFEALAINVGEAQPMRPTPLRSIMKLPGCRLVKA